MSIDDGVIDGKKVSGFAGLVHLQEERILISS